MTSEPFALRLQLLKSLPQKVIAAAALVSATNETGTFTARELERYFVDLAIPMKSGNVSRTLTRLSEHELAFSVPDVAGAWKLTPLGWSEVDDLMSHLDPTALESGWRGAEFAHVEQTIIPWYMAPPRWHVGIRRLMETHSFETNVFIMTRFPSEGAPENPDEADPVSQAVHAIRDTLKGYGLAAHVASDRLIEDDLLGNVGSYMWGCKYGVGIVEDRVGRGLNYNAVIEIGGMILTGRRCAVLKDDTGDEGKLNLPTDLSGQVYKSVNLDDPETVAEATDAWARQDLGLARLKR